MISNPWIQKLLAFNPMYAPISIVRKALVDRPLEPELIWISVGSGVLFLILGILYFRKTEGYFADLA
jgi:lipopolysaccharide transport system permease protein